jgi:pyruvate dehydrogenase E2 component (dihydrolipoamide acetyltransferase)
VTVADLLTMPEVAAGSTEAVLASWNVDIEKPFSAGDPIVTVETEKAIVDVEADADGVLLHLLAPVGATVEVGAPIAVKGAPGEKAGDIDALLASLGVNDAGAAPIAGADEPEATASTVAAEVSPANLPEADITGTGPVGTPDGRQRVFASPLARKLAKEAGLDLATVRGTGPNGRIRRADIGAALRDRDAGSTSAYPAARVPVPAAQAAGATFTDVPNSRMRQAIARRVTESKQTTPHFYVRGPARVDRLLELRRELNDGGQVKISVNDLVVKAVAKAHTLVPGLNVQWNGDSIRHFTGVDVSVAVATEHGLVTPVVRGVDTLSISRLADATRDLVARAKERRLQQTELEGGTISVTNLGMYGTEEFAAIINPPQASILAVGAARPEAVVDDGQVTAATVLRVTLAVDHRAVDGATAAEWMRAFTGLMERPAQILA